MVMVEWPPETVLCRVCFGRYTSTTFAAAAVVVVILRLQVVAVSTTACRPSCAVENVSVGNGDRGTKLGDRPSIASRAS